MDTDYHDEIINGEYTYIAIAKVLNSYSPIMIGWTDEMGTHFDILFNYDVLQVHGNIQGGMGKRRDLYVTIMRWGSFAFTTQHPFHESYVGEKLGLSGATAKKITELLNGVLNRLNLTIE